MSVICVYKFRKPFESAKINSFVIEASDRLTKCESESHP